MMLEDGVDEVDAVGDAQPEAPLGPEQLSAIVKQVRRRPRCLSPALAPAGPCGVCKAIYMCMGTTRRGPPGERRPGGRTGRRP